jgi:cytochrome o ubiquinol oxidase subunit 2
MNTFFVPALGSMIYTMYGMATELYLEASHEGVYYGRSAQFSGDGFSGMQFAVNAVSEQAFDKWAAQARAKSGQDLDVQHYLALAMQSQNVKPFTYHAVVPGLFRAIATQSLPPAPGPKTGEPSASVRPR